MVVKNNLFYFVYKLMPKGFTQITKGTFGTPNIDYIRNNNFYYWK